MATTTTLSSVLGEIEYMFYLAHDREPADAAEYGTWLLDQGPDGAESFLGTPRAEEQLQQWRLWGREDVAA